MTENNTNAIERVAIMMKTGASEDTIENYIHSLYEKFEIGDRTFSLLESMVIDYFYK